MERALIIGIGGQDDACLAEHLLSLAATWSARHRMREVVRTMVEAGIGTRHRWAKADALSL